MADVDTGMDKQEMKKLLMVSKKQPVNCAVAQGGGKSAAFAMLMLDKVKASKALVKDLEKKFPDAKAPLFGTASVDPDVDPKLVRFMVNKPASGIARKLTKTLKEPASARSS